MDKACPFLFASAVALLILAALVGQKPLLPPALLVCLLLGACGGTADGGCVPKPVVRVQLFGDSTQKGSCGSACVGLSGYVKQPPATLLQDLVDRKFGPGAVVVSSRAVGGTTAKQLVAGTDGLNLPWPGSVDADIVVVNHGINDMAHDGATLGLPAYRDAFGVLAKAPAVVVFETPNLSTVYDVAAYAQAMRQVAADNRLAVADTYAITTPAMLGDGVHPTQDGYSTIVSQSLAPAVVPIIAGMRCQVPPTGE